MPLGYCIINCNRRDVKVKDKYAAQIDRCVQGRQAL